MPTLAFFFGSILMLIGVIGYAYAYMAGTASLTALIPAAIGVLLAILGVAAMRNEGPRKHLMHAAVILAFVGMGAMIGRMISKGGIAATAADIATAATAAVLLVFILLSVKSFMSARAARL